VVPSRDIAARSPAPWETQEALQPSVAAGWYNPPVNVQIPTHTIYIYILFMIYIYEYIYMYIYICKYLFIYICTYVCLLFIYIYYTIFYVHIRSCET
jgi:hypothetical protein